jgi:SUZ domain
MAASPSCLQRSCGDQVSIICNSSQQAPSVTPSMMMKGPVGSAKELVSSDESITTALSNESSIDSALISALSDPRERVALLRCEQHFVTFLQTPDVTEILVGGSYNSIIHGLSQNQQQPTNTVTMPGGGTWSNQGISNTFPSINSRPTSFQRCWLHRLADRFGIVREPVNTEWIKCQKTSQSAMPAQLLCNHVEEKTPKGKRPNKMKIMKRNSSSSSSLTRKNKDDNEPRKGKDKIATSSAAGTLKRTSLSDKEKAYAEARARIFQLDEADVGVSSGTPSSSILTTTTDTTSPPALSNSPTLEIPPEDAPITPSTHNWASGISKVTWRNRQEEENDPDFQRGILYTPQDMAYYYQTQAQLQPKMDQHQQLQMQQQQYQLPHQYQGTPNMYYYNPSFSNDSYRSTPSAGSAPAQQGGYPTSSS